MSPPYERFMLTANSDGKLTRAVFQRQVDEPVLFHESINYEDVRELPISSSSKEPNNLEDEWKAEFVDMSHEQFVEFISWLWSDECFTLTQHHH